MKGKMLKAHKMSLSVGVERKKNQQTLAPDAVLWTLGRKLQDIDNSFHHGTWSKRAGREQSVVVDGASAGWTEQRPGCHVPCVHERRKNRPAI